MAVANTSLVQHLVLSLKTNLDLFEMFFVSSTDGNKNYSVPATAFPLDSIFSRIEYLGLLPILIVEEILL